MTRHLFIVSLIFSVLSFSCAHSVKVEGTAMLPNFKEGDKLLINTNFGELRRSDVVVFLYPKDKTRTYLKRIIGLPNETIEIKAGKVFSNDKELAEEYLDQTYNQSESNLSARKIEVDSYFVMGDNRDNSSDSRLWGNN